MFWVLVWNQLHVHTCLVFKNVYTVECDLGVGQAIFKLDSYHT